MTARPVPPPITAPAGGAWTFDPAALAAAITERRRELKISRREVVRQAGAGTPSTLTRLDEGRHISVDVFLRLLLWLGCTDVRPFLATIPASAEEATGA
ncbi:transcriptional regulator [Micromonospora sp. RV43]|uniref:helix-turn-helix domain-containing protein n=1 Tax=Micromonospora sp. RV43 TaxID=1661387 RepID=UPI00064C02F2|nr:transcriptional regulator [Micromonospora sp. RV43]